MSTSNLDRALGREGPSVAQRQQRAAVGEVMRAWEGLSDAQRLAWDLHGSERRMKGVSCFKMVNLRRRLRGQAISVNPAQAKPCDAKPLLKGLDIRNRGGRITLELELRRAPEGLVTVWGSLPCNRGRKQPRNCPRLGVLPPRQGKWCNITTLYFNKHGDSIKRHDLPMIGKRIFIRVRREVDEGKPLYEQVKEVVPRPEVEIGKKAYSPSKDHRRGIEGVSKVLRSIKPATRHPRATRRPRP
jgi:hypothetical protein